MEGFVGLHVGAGHHSSKLHTKYKQLCRKASRIGTNLLKEGKSALDVVEAMTVYLEDSPLTNAGYGSSLTWDGCVECDASIMEGSTLRWGAVGAVSGVKNPVTLARHLCNKQGTILALGRVPPCLLVGSGARKWAEKAGIETVSPESLTSAKSLKLHQHYKRKVNKYETLTGVQLSPLDTIGALAVDMTGSIAASCSSGGLVLKHEGRVGQAAAYGAGVWAECTKDISIAACTSGCGEYLMRTMLAKEAVEVMKNSDCPTSALHDVMKNKFLGSPFLNNIEEKLGGIAMLKVGADGYGEFLWAHTTTTMGLGYASTSDNSVKSRISCLTPGTAPGSSIVVEGITFKMNRICIQNGTEVM